MASPTESFLAALHSLPPNTRRAMLASGELPSGIASYLAKLQADESASEYNPLSFEGGPATGGMGTAEMDPNSTNSLSLSDVSLGQVAGMIGMAMNPIAGLAKSIAQHEMQGKSLAPLALQISTPQPAAQNIGLSPEVTQSIADAIAAASGTAAENAAASAAAAAEATAAAEAGEGGNTGVGVGEGTAGNADARSQGGLINFAGGGMVHGPGGGLDDAVMATMGNEMAALSDGEYVMPADVVSALGDGSSKAGARKLDGLSAMVRKRKYGKAKQPPRLRKGLMAMVEAA